MIKGFKIFEKMNTFSLRPERLIGQTEFRITVKTEDNMKLVNGLAKACLFSDGKYYVRDKENNIWPDDISNKYLNIEEEYLNEKQREIDNEQEKFNEKF